MKFSEFKDILAESVTSMMGGQKVYGESSVKNAKQFLQDFGEGAAVFVADKLAFFGDSGAARNEARSLVERGFSRDSIRIRRIVPDTTYKDR